VKQNASAHKSPQAELVKSDGCGVVEAIGDSVASVKVGDRVAPVFPQGHHYVSLCNPIDIAIYSWIPQEEDLALRSLKRGLGGAIDGVAAEYFVCDQDEVVHIPSNFTYEQGSTLSVAFTTAWSSLYSHHPKLKSGETVLCLGTGGVSLAAAQVSFFLHHPSDLVAEGSQIALASGARVILTSSSSAKLTRATSLLKPLLRAGAPETTIQTIDYSAINDWDKEARRMTNGKGVDFVIEIAGRGTLARSIRSTRQGGLVAVSGESSGFDRFR
jgi:NADPH:quinone reductase-like Zn-dependent oxidoreductase